MKYTTIYITIVYYNDAENIRITFKRIQSTRVLNLCNIIEFRMSVYFSMLLKIGQRH